MIKVLVCGGRNFTDREIVFGTLDAVHAEHQISLVIHGGAMGADYLAHEWASRHRIIVRTFMAEWDRYKRAAGPIRNERMLVEGRPDIVVAFPGGKGTENTVSLAMKAAVPVYRISKNGGVS